MYAMHINKNKELKCSKLFVVLFHYHSDRTRAKKPTNHGSLERWEEEEEGGQEQEFTFVVTKRILVTITSNFFRRLIKNRTYNKAVESDMKLSSNEAYEIQRNGGQAI